MGDNVIVSKELDKITFAVANLNNVIRSDASKVFRKFVVDIYNDIVLRSPVDKSTYKKDWELKTISSSGKDIEVMRITNGMPYATVMETGSPVGGLPWPGVGMGGKTVVNNGRIWSSQSPEPVAGTALESADTKGLLETLSKIITGEF